MKPFFALAIVCVGVSFTFLPRVSRADKGGKETGGGNAIVGPGQTVGIADPFYKNGSEPVTSGCEDPEMAGGLAPEKELDRIGDLLVHYGGAWARIPNFSRDVLSYSARISRFLAEQVLRPENHFCRVPVLPKQESGECINYQTPAGSHCEPVAYTEGKTTWLREDLFDHMTGRDRALLLVHERLHGFAGNVPHDPIVAITTGLKEALDLQDLQAAGERPQLDKLQMSRLQSMTAAIRDLGLYLDETGLASPIPLERFQIVRNGGGLVSTESSVDPSAYIGAGSFVPPATIVAPQAVILNTDLCSTRTRVGSGVPSQVNHVELRNYSKDDLVFGFSVGPEAFLKDSNLLYCDSTVAIGKKARIENSIIAQGDSKSGAQGFLLMGEEAKILDTTLWFPNKVQMDDHSAMAHNHASFDTHRKTGDYFFYVNLWMQKGSSLSNLRGNETLRDYTWILTQRIGEAISGEFAYQYEGSRDEETTLGVRAGSQISLDLFVCGYYGSLKKGKYLAQTTNDVCPRPDGEMNNE